MQYHAMSLLDNGFAVALIGYGGSQCHERLLSDPQLTQHLLRPFPRLPRVLFPLYAPAKAALQSAQLFTVLMYASFDAKFLLLQNPPAIPTLLIAQIVCALLRCKLVIDWHNFGFTQLALSLGRAHWIVRIAHW
jgi:beta-1,4-mannosyltransferase